MKQTFIYVTTQTEFIHQYKDAPDEVSYLRYPHRHVAHIKIKVEVFNNDREIEFIVFKHEIERNLKLNLITNNSCEMVADQLLSFVQDKYGTNRDVVIIVSEDAENGCELVYRKEASLT